MDHLVYAKNEYVSIFMKIWSQLRKMYHYFRRPLWMGPSSLHRKQVKAPSKYLKHKHAKITRLFAIIKLVILVKHCGLNSFVFEKFWWVSVIHQNFLDFNKLNVTCKCMFKKWINCRTPVMNRQGLEKTEHFRMKQSLQCVF